MSGRVTRAASVIFICDCINAQLQHSATRGTLSRWLSGLGGFHGSAVTVSSAICFQTSEERNSFFLISYVVSSLLADVLSQASFWSVFIANGSIIGHFEATISLMLHWRLVASLTNDRVRFSCQQVYHYWKYTDRSCRQLFTSVVLLDTGTRSRYAKVDRQKSMHVVNLSARKLQCFNRTLSTHTKHTLRWADKA
jgi:hypothetical protein